MASIATAIKLNDQMSTPLMKIVNNMNKMQSSWDSLESSTSGGLDMGVEDVQKGLEKSVRAMDNLGDEANQAARGVDRMGNEQEQFNRYVQQGANAMDGLGDQIMGAVGAYISLQSLGKLVNLSDTYTQTMARLDMINDGSQTTEQLFNKIAASADRSRALIGDTADLVAKLSLNAGDAFASNKEAILFAENLNKLYTIAGTEQAAMTSSSLQLTQALGSGVLRGEEFNAVFEAAPNIMQTVADYMGVPIGKLREMAAEGKITANTVKYALLSATDDINAKFNSMPLTWGQVWTHIKNIAYQAITPILTAINWMANNWEMLSPIIMGVATALLLYAGVAAIAKAATMAQAFAAAFMAAKTALAEGATFLWTVQQHGLNAALAACPLTWIIGLIIVLIAAFYAVIAAVNKFAGTSVSATGIITGALAALGAFILNILIFAWNNIASFVELLVNIWKNPEYAIKRFIVNIGTNWLEFLLSCITGTESLVGAVVGSFYAISQAIKNVIATIINYGIDFIESFVNGWNQGVYLIKSAFVSIAKIVLKVAETILSAMGGLISSVINGIISVINTALDGINAIIRGVNKIPGVDIDEITKINEVELDLGADSVSALQDTMDEWLGDGPETWEAPWSEWETGSIADAYAEGKQVGANFVSDTVDGINKNIAALESWAGEAPEDYWEAPKFDYIELSEAYNAGYEWGAETEENLFNPDDYLTEWGAESGSGSGDEYPAYDELAGIEGNTGDVAGSAGSIEDALDITNENLKYLRDLAEQEVINRFTTAEIKVEMGGVNNTVNQNTDLDGVIDYMVTGVQEAMERVAEGVHD